MLRSPLKWVGGKSRLRETIVGRIPPHTCYVEVFSGAAWVLFGKPVEMSKSEVLNDLDGELVNFWRVIKHRPAEFTEAASWLLASRELFEEWKPLPSVGGEIARAIRFYAVLRIAFGAKRTQNHFGMRREARPSIRWPLLKEEVARVVERLQLVWIEHLSWDHCVDAYDRPESFFYLDPPYRARASDSYRHSFTDEDHARLADRLLGAKGRWLLSCNDDDLLRRLYRRRGINIEPVKVSYSLQAEGTHHGAELLVSNY